MAFRWRAEVGPLIEVFGWFLSLPYQQKNQKKIVVKVGPPLTKHPGFAHVHCPIYGIFKILNPRILILAVWYYELGNNYLMQLKASDVPWETFKNDNIYTYADNLHNAVITIARECIHSKQTC